MTKLKPLYILLVLISSLLLTNCSTSEDDPNNNPPGLFSAYAFDTTVDGASVEWTESIDTDDDPVTYAIILEGQEITSGLNKGEVYTFSGLEPETIYAGYVEARDGKGGTSIAEFSFVTEPEVIIFNVSASWWFHYQDPVSDGIRAAFRAGFRVPYYEDAVSYQIEIIDYALFGYIRTNDQNQNGKVYTWTNESQSTPIGPVFRDQAIPGEYGVAFGGTGITDSSPNYNTTVSNYEATIGEARVTVVISKK